MLGDENSVLEEDGPLIWALDDEQTVLSLLGDVLSQGGYRFEGFLAREEMEQALEARQPSLLLLDWMLPGSSGHEVLKRWVTHHGEIPVVVVTAVSGESVLLNAFESGARDVVRKPFDVTELLVRVHRQLTQSSRAHDEHAHMARQDRLVSFASELMRCQDVTACWQVLSQMLARELGAELYSQRGGELRAHDDATHLLDLSKCERPWRKLMQGQGVWLSEREHALLGGQAEHAYIAPLHDGVHLHGVMWWTGKRRALDIPAFMTQVAQLVMVSVGRFSHHDEMPHEGALTFEFLERIVEASPDAIVAADRTGRIILFNAAAERILQWDRRLALGSDVRCLYEEGVAYQIMRRLRGIQEGGRGRLAKCRETLLTYDREAIPVELSAALITQGDEILGTVGLFRDIRDRIAMEGQLERATQDLAAHREQVVMAEMAGATAHELNQPLTSMFNYIEVLKADEHLGASPRSRRAVEVIERDVTRLAEIVRQIGQITQYRTRSYVENTRILDLGDERDEP